MPRRRHAQLMRRAACAATLLAAAMASALPATSTAAVPNACLYSYDQEWREVNVQLAGTTTAATAGGAPIASPSTPLAAGDKVTLTGGTLTATLPDWVAKFGADSGLLTDGQTIPVSGWITLDATNTAERVVGPLHFDTLARVDLVLEPGGGVSESASTVKTDPVPLPTTTWTATGGPVRVSQAYADTLGELPVGRNGSMTTPEGSLAVSTTIDDFTLTLECLAGTTGGLGAVGLVESVPPVIGQTWTAPAYTGALSSGSFAPPADDAIDAELVPVDGPQRAAVGTTSTFSGQQLEVRLTPEQRDAWLGGDSPSIGATLTLAANDATPATQTVTASGSVADGSDIVRLTLAPNTWTRTAEKNVEIKPSGPITITAAGKPTLTLTPAPNGSGAFARLHRSRATVKAPDNPGGETDRPSTTNPPSLGEQGGFRPPPTVIAKSPVATIVSTSLKPRKNQLSLKLANPRATDSRVRVQIVTTKKVKLGGKTKTVTITSAKTVTLKAGKTATLKLALTKDARALLKSTKKTTVAVTVTPVGSTTTAPASKQLTLRR